MLLHSTFEGTGGIALGLFALVASATAKPLDAASLRPCDIYAAGGTPCVAAHSTTRALYANYTGKLYELTRGSDNSTYNVTVGPGGIANSSAQDIFCKGTTCLISLIFDQSGHNNNLGQAPGGNIPGPSAKGRDNLASAIGAPVTLNGQRVYGVFIPPGTGYRNNSAKGTALNDDPEGMYAVVDGSHYSANCCFDYGNAENDTIDHGAATMEAISINGNSSSQGGGPGPGPWLRADFEVNLYTYASKEGKNPHDPSITARFFTAILKGAPNLWSLRGGDATSGNLSTYYSGVRPSDDKVMKKTGAIVLGVGGDNSHAGQGTFYEGAMTVGYPSNDTENDVQANIVAAGYGTTSLISGTGLTINSSVSLRVTSPGLTTNYLTHNDQTNVTAQVVTSSSSTALQQAASFTIRAGLGFSGCYSFESNDRPGNFIHASYYVRKTGIIPYPLLLEPYDNTTLFAEDATFCPQTSFNGQSSSTTFRSWSNPTRFIRLYNGTFYAGSNGTGLNPYDTSVGFNNDVSFVVNAGFAKA